MVVMLLFFVWYMMWLFVVDAVADGMAVVIGRVVATMVWTGQASCTNHQNGNIQAVDQQPRRPKCIEAAAAAVL